MPQQGGINAPYTRLRGPLLVGQSSDFGVAAVNGGSSAPLISFWNASEHGIYVVSSAETRWVSAGTPMIFTSAGLKIGSTSFQTAGAATNFLIIPQTTASMSSGTAPTNAAAGAALMFEHGNSTGTGRLWIYSSISGWMGTTGMIFTTTTT